MRRRILAYTAAVDALLAQWDTLTPVQQEAVLREHLTQIGFFAHERLIHLLVMLGVALFTVLFFIAGKCFSAVLLVVALALLILLVPYILHYFLLENQVQYMYRQYDRMMKATEGCYGILS